MRQVLYLKVYIKTKYFRAENYIIGEGIGRNEAEIEGFGTKIRKG